jgi:hypothetical protein
MFKESKQVKIWQKLSKQHDFIKHSLQSKIFHCIFAPLSGLFPTLAAPEETHA